MIKLTKMNPLGQDRVDHVWIEPKHITMLSLIMWVHPDTYATEIKTVNGTVAVKETPEEVMAMPEMLQCPIFPVFPQPYDPLAGFSPYPLATTK